MTAGRPDPPRTSDVTEGVQKVTWTLSLALLALMTVLAVLVALGYAALALTGPAGFAVGLLFLVGSILVGVQGWRVSSRGDAGPGRYLILGWLLLLVGLMLPLYLV